MVTVWIMLFPAMLQFFSNLPIMLSDFRIMVRGIAYYAQILNEVIMYFFLMMLINAGALSSI